MTVRDEHCRVAVDDPRMATRTSSLAPVQSAGKPAAQRTIAVERRRVGSRAVVSRALLAPFADDTRVGRLLEASWAVSSAPTQLWGRGELSRAEPWTSDPPLHAYDLRSQCNAWARTSSCLPHVSMQASDRRTPPRRRPQQRLTGRPRVMRQRFRELVGQDAG